MRTNWPIKKVKLQGRYIGYDTDDLIVFIQRPDGGEECKILGQIKHSIRITESDLTFGETIADAWRDFNNSSLFTKGKDAIALMTGPLSATDVNDTRTILEWARHSDNAEDFVKKVYQTRFSSRAKQKKTKAFKTHLNTANGGNPISKDDLFEFMQHFHLLGYDLDREHGVTMALIQSLIGQYDPRRVTDLWARIVEEVQSANQNAGTITLESLPEDLRSVFKKQVSEKSSTSQLSMDKSGWSHRPDKNVLIVANFLGSWNDRNEADLEIIRRLSELE